MAILGNLLRKGVEIGKRYAIRSPAPYEIQKRELKKLLKAAKETQFGRMFHFGFIIEAYKLKINPRYYYKVFSENIPIYNYDKMYADWWFKTLEGTEDVCWPGKVKFFALSSGTSGSASKHIPITKELMKANKKAGIRQMLTLRNFNVDYKDILTRGVLMLGGSTDLFKQKDYYEGDLSGIMASKLPFWLTSLYKPGKKIASIRDWNKKLSQITLRAGTWDMGYVAGVPAWMTILFERIIKHHKVQNIHEVWPNLAVYAHGGVAFEPYRASFEKLLGKPLIYIETYLASEGFIALQLHPDRPMKLLLDNGIFFEFVLFNEANFDEDGEIRPQAKTLLIDEVEEGKDYALLISTVAGAWRYLIGDTIKFVNKKEAEIILTGRTKHFISLCGEHLSVDNMNKAIEYTAIDLNVRIVEYAVAGIPEGKLFAHKWYLACDEEVDAVLLKEKIDFYLSQLNDDYKTERQEAIKEIYINVLPTTAFYGWLKAQGKEGGQNKFPRVLKKAKLEEWESFLTANKYV
ncbi:MAG: GH3 auxin-responsive promoter family protein [Cytophagales bacterium]